MQEELHLTVDQKNEMLNARRRMLARLNDLVAQRKAMVSQLGLELLQAGRVSPCFHPLFGIWLT